MDARMETATKVSEPAPAETTELLYVARFRSNSAKLAVNDKGRLQELVPDLEQTPLAVTGYTDAIGSQAHNDRLALQRAAPVKDHLIALGLVPEAIVALGHGKCCYVQPNATAAGRAANRRAEVRRGEAASMTDARARIIPRIF